MYRALIQCEGAITPRSYGCVQVGFTIILALAFLLPGILYAVYVDNWRKRCPQCDQKSLVPDDSPGGRAMLKKIKEANK